jgi:hypothetical protein
MTDTVPGRVHPHLLGAEALHRPAADRDHHPLRQHEPDRYPHSVCRYAESQYKVHYVCVPCRRSNKYPWDGAEHLCPECRAPMVFAGHDFAAPRRHDKSGWAAVAAVLEAGLRYEGFQTCGCSRDPKFRPRTSAQVRARRRLADRTGIDVAVMLAARDPYSVRDTGDQSPGS